MKRPQNFRVWCKDHNEWEKDRCFLSQDGVVYQMLSFGFLKAIRPENHVVQFDTGLKDKRGKKIFEGDILRVNGYLGSKHYVKVDYETSEASDDMGVDMIGYRRYTEYGEPEIVGNIFENPKLLK